MSWFLVVGFGGVWLNAVNKWRRGSWGTKKVTRASLDVWMLVLCFAHGSRGAIFSCSFLLPLVLALEME